VGATQSRRAQQIKGQDGNTIIQFYVPNGELEFNLAALTARGLTDVIDQIEQVFDEVSGRPLTSKSPFVLALRLVDQWQRVSEDALDPCVAAMHDHADAHHPEGMV
jgi:hypothetical protein